MLTPAEHISAKIQCEGESFKCMIKRQWLNIIALSINVDGNLGWMDSIGWLSPGFRCKKPINSYTTEFIYNKYVISIILPPSFSAASVFNNFTDVGLQNPFHSAA